MPADGPTLRREFLGLVPALAATGLLRAAAGRRRARVGLCTFSCHQHWRAVGAKQPGVRFADTVGFFRYARELGAQGVQTGLRSRDPAVARRLRAAVEETHGTYEGELRLPKTANEVADFEREVQLTCEAGATIARAVFTGGRRYEIFKTLEEFRRFSSEAGASLALAEPVLRRHRLQVAMENHKDFTTEELLELMRRFGGEWIGVLVDTGNNLALLEDPLEVVEALAPYALSVHWKDMAVQPAPEGFLLSEVPLGTGLLDLPKIAATLVRARSEIVFNLEMATRDPLTVPCLADGYWPTFPERRATHLAAALERVQANPPRQPPPAVAGKPVAQILAEEETNNRHGLAWMLQHLPV